MTDYIDSVNDRTLAGAPDDLGFFDRIAQGGEECYLCGRTLATGEMYDRLFVVACMDCHDAQQERIKDRLEEQDDEQI